MKPILILSFLLALNNINAQTYQAEYRGELEILSLENMDVQSSGTPKKSEFTISQSEKKMIDSADSPSSKNFLLKVLNEGLQHSNFHTEILVTFNDSLRKIEIQPHSFNPMLYVKKKEIYKVYNSQKSESFHIRIDANKLKKTEKLSLWKSEQLLKDKDTLIDGKHYRFIKFQEKNKDEKELYLFFIDSQLPANMYPIPGDFDTLLGVEGGVFKLIRIYAEGSSKMTTKLMDYKKIEDNKIIYPKKKTPP